MKRILFGLILLLAFGQSTFAQVTTTNLGISKPQTGQNQPQVTIATGFDAFDSAVAGRLSKSVAGGSDVTLTAAEARNAIHEYTGVLTGNINVIVPAKNKLYAIYNNTTGSFTLTVKTAAGTGVVVTQTQRVWLYCDATNVIAFNAGAGGVSGTGTTGTLAKFTGSSTVGNSLLSESGTTVTTAGRQVISGVTINTDATGAVAGLTVNGTFTKNDSNTRVFDVLEVEPTFSFGGSNTGTTVNLLTVNSTSAGSTGAVVNSINLKRDGTSTFSVSSAGAVAFASGVRQAFAPDGTVPGLNVGVHGSDPSAAVPGDVYYNNSTNKFRCYQNSAWTDCIPSGASGLGDPGVNGVVVRTASNTTTARTITGTSNEITVADGSGVAANPTLSLASTFDISGKTSTKPVKTGTSDPGTCGVGELLFRTDLTAGQNLKGCTSTNTWTALGAAGGAPALNSVTDPTGNWTLDMNANLVALTWDSNFSTSSAFKLAGANTSATGPLFHVSTGVSNNIIPVLVEPRGGQAFKITELGNVVLGAPSPISSTTTGFPYIPVIQSNAEPAGTPTSITGAAPLQLEADAVFGEYRMWTYLGGAWRNLTPIGGMWASQSGTGAQTINWSTSHESVSTRQITMTGNVTLSFTAPQRAGTMCVLITVQDGTGGRNITWPASVKWPGGSAGTPTTSASAKDTWTFVYDGTNYQYLINANDVK